MNLAPRPIRPNPRVLMKVRVGQLSRLGPISRRGSCLHARTLFNRWIRHRALSVAGSTFRLLRAIAIAAMACWGTVGACVPASFTTRTRGSNEPGAFAGAACGHTCRSIFTQLWDAVLVPNRRWTNVYVRKKNQRKQQRLRWTIPWRDLWRGRTGKASHRNCRVLSCW